MIQLQFPITQTFIHRNLHWTLSATVQRDFFPPPDRALGHRAVPRPHLGRDALPGYRGAMSEPRPLVGVIMGSRSDLETLQPAIDLLREFQVPHEVRIVSAHRTPAWMFAYAQDAEGRGLRVIIAAAGGAAHLPGMTAACTILPVLGVPVAATGLLGMDALLSIAQMPKGVPVGTLAVGKPGAANAALLAIRMLALHDADLRERLRAWVAARADEVLAHREV